MDESELKTVTDDLGDVEIRVHIDLPVKEGSRFRVEIWNDCSVIKYETDSGETIQREIPVILFDTELREAGVAETASTLKAISLVQKLDEVEAAALFAYSFIATENLARELDGFLPLHRLPAENPLDGSSSETKALMSSSPLFQFNRVMSNWILFGGEHLDCLFGMDSSFALKPSETISFKRLPPVVVDLKEKARIRNLDTAEIGSMAGFPQVWLVDKKIVRLKNQQQAKAVAYIAQKTAAGISIHESDALDFAGYENKDRRIPNLFKGIDGWENLIVRDIRAHYKINPSASPHDRRLPR